MPNTNPPAAGVPDRGFLEKAYWILGSAAVAWSIVALMCVIRRRSVDIPLFGKVQPVEAIIFTQGAFCLLLPLLLGVIATFRSESALRGWHVRFPGVLAKDWNVPDALGWLRVAVFLGLVVLPVTTMGFCYRRMVDKLEIYSIGDKLQAPLRRGEMFGFAPARDARGGTHDWRWRGEEIALGAGEEPARITAFPLWQPWIHRVVFYGSAAATLWFLLTPAGTLRRRVLGWPSLLPEFETSKRSPTRGLRRPATATRRRSSRTINPL